MIVAPVQREGNPGCAYAMVAVRDARRRIAPRVLKGFLVSAFLMEVAAGVSFWHAPKVRRVVPCSARHTVAGKGVCLKGVPKVQKEVRRFARVMVVENVVPLKVVVFARQAFMAEPYSVWHMVVARDVWSPVAQEVQGGALTVVFAMVVVRDANLEGVGKVHKVAPTSARPMVVGRDAHGDSLVQSMV